MNASAHPTHHAKRQLDRFTHFHTTTQQIPIGYNGTPQINPQTALPLRRSPPKSNTPIPGPIPLTTPNGIQIQLVVLPLLTCEYRQMAQAKVLSHKSSALWTATR